MTNQTIYTVGGTVQAGGGFYIKRKADDELLEYCRAGEFAFILSSRQVGKSSLMVRTAQQLEQENIRSVIIDLSSIGVKISADEWYLGILNDISNTLNLQTDIFSWWSDRAGLGPAQRLTNFFRDVLLKEVSEPVVIFFDEIDSTLSIPFADDFFAALRAIYNARSTVADFKRLSFVMIGVATPSDLIADDKRTPFNIGHRVDLTDFTPEEAFPLAGELGAKTMGWVFAWTGGHPYLTQRLCAYLARNKVEHTEETVAAAVRDIFEGEQGKQDNNLQFVRDMLTKRAPDIQRVLKTYKDVRSGKKVPDDERSMPKSHLKISGVVRRSDVNLSTRNRIYERNFDLKWIKENTPSTTARKLVIASSIVAIIALAIAGAFAWQSYTRTPAERAAQFDGNFQNAQTPKERLKNLAGLFELQDETYAAEARQLFNDLPQEDKLALFVPGESKSVSEDQIVVVQGLYTHLGNSENENQLLEKMAIVAPPFADEIKRWLEGRRIILTGKDYDSAVEKLTLAIGKNDQNPAVFYDRAQAYMEWGEGYYPKALADLNTMMRLDESRGSDAYHLINNFSGGRASLLISNFQTAQSPEARLKNLAGLFSLKEGVYSATARGLFASLSQDDKLALFEPGTVQGVSENQAAVVEGLYTYLYNTGQENELLAKMARAVPSHADEISLWLEGRRALNEKDIQGAADKLTLAIKKNVKNPAMYYDRAQAYISLGEEHYPDALADLARMVRLDRSRRADAYNTGATPSFSEYWNKSIVSNEYKDVFVRAAGVDVSYWDAEIDWVSVKDFGVEFVFMKATEGDYYQDPTLVERLASTNSVGLPRSAYHFFRANVDPIKQAESYIRTLEAANSDTELPPIFDMETNDGKSREEIMAGAKIWLDLVEQAFGEKPIIYSPQFFLENYFSTQNGTPPDWVSEYSLWLAQYPASYSDGLDPFALPNGWSDWAFWQYSDKGVVPGINASADMNVFNGSSSDLRKFIAETTAAPTEQSAQEKTFSDLTQPIDANPYDAQAYVIRGIAYIYYAQYQPAIDDFTRAIKINPADAQPYMQRGVAYARTGDYKKAIADFDQAIKLKSDYADAYLNRGKAYEALGQMENSAADTNRYNELMGNTTTP